MAGRLAAQEGACQGAGRHPCRFFDSLGRNVAGRCEIGEAARVAELHHYLVEEGECRRAGGLKPGVEVAHVRHGDVDREHGPNGINPEHLDKLVDYRGSERRRAGFELVGEAQALPEPFRHLGIREPLPAPFLHEQQTVAVHPLLVLPFGLLQVPHHITPRGTESTIRRYSGGLSTLF